MDRGTAVLITVLSPLITGLVTAAGIALERRRTDHDLEVRRLRLVELARNQIAAVEPLLNPAGADEAGVGADSRERAYSIVVSALDMILRAQALTQQEDHLRQRAAKVVERRSGGILSELLLRRRLHSSWARLLRIVYYLAFTWGGLGFAVVVGVAMSASDPEIDAATVAGTAVFFFFTGLIPVLILRRMVLGCERRYDERQLEREAAPPPPPPPAVPPPAPHPYYGVPSVLHSQPR